MLPWPNCQHYKNNTKAFINFGGDFNAPNIDWESGFTTPDCRNKESCEKLINTFNKFNLTQMQQQLTEIYSGSLLYEQTGARKIT